MATVHFAATQKHALPFAHGIAMRIQPWIGWIWEDEVLVALTHKVAARCDSDPPVLVEIDSYCGRATAAMGLAVHSLGRHDARIISVDEPPLARPLVTYQPVCAWLMAGMTTPASAKMSRGTLHDIAPGTDHIGRSVGRGSAVGAS